MGLRRLNCVRTGRIPTVSKLHKALNRRTLNREFSENDPGPIVLLHNFSPHFPNNSWIKGAWGLGVKEDTGRIRLYVSYDPRQFYLEGQPSELVVNRWDEKAGLRRDAVGSQVIDVL